MVFTNLIRNKFDKMLPGNKRQAVQPPVSSILTRPVQRARYHGLKSPGVRHQLETK